MRVVAVIQARMGSTRLPGKVLQRIGDRSMLAWTIQRAQLADTIDEVVVATTTQHADDAIVDHLEGLGTRCFRGSENDVLDRYRGAARDFDADVVVRITSDCPLVDPGIADAVVGRLVHADPPADYCSNTVARTYPRGLDVEAFPRATLERCWRDARAPHQRTHVTSFVYENPDQFRILQVTEAVDRNAWRWTVDTPEDLAFVREVYRRLGNRFFGWHEVVDLMEADPHLAALNAHIRQKALQEG